MTAREFPALVVASTAKGFVLCRIEEIQDLVSHMCGEPVWTHELADRALLGVVQYDLHRQHPVLTEVEVADVTPENWQEKAAGIVRHLPEKLSVERIPDYTRGFYPYPLKAEMVRVPGAPEHIMRRDDGTA